MAELLNVRTNLKQTDTSIALMDHIKNNYTLTHPSKESIKFDTKFSDFSKENFIIIEKMPGIAKSQIIGKGRIQYTDTKRVQIICNTKSARNDIFLLQEHIDDIINSSPSGMQSYGIDTVEMTEFQPINFTTDKQINDLTVNETEDFISRSFVTVILKYTKIVV